jgi:phosphoglucomutase
MSYEEAYRYWSESAYFSEETRRELTSMTDLREIEDRFYRDLDFGTGGLRGIVGAGTNRMNIYTVRRASQGVADYVRHAALPEGVEGIAIAYDSRRMSKEFAREAACVFAANGITAYLFRELMPTPVLSFTVRHLKCAAGVVVTASHNPKEYNGYKVYGMDGGQVTDALAEEISRRIREVEPIDCIRTMDFEAAVADKRIRRIEDSVPDAYVAQVLGLSGHASPEAKQSLKVAYTPLHGAGLVPVTRVLAEAGFPGVYVVSQQSAPDTEFSTVKSPNPEDHNALAMAIELAKEKNADIVIATDPDSDRLGIAVKDREGGFVFLTGNQLGCLLLDARLQAGRAAGRLKPEDYIVKTIVSTRMAEKIAKEYGVRIFDVLTGFKYIGEMIREIETDGQGDFIFGFEESYGYLAGTFARDKDAVIAALLACEAAAACKAGGHTLVDALEALYGKYGYYAESLKNYSFPGKDGAEKIRSLMDGLRGAASKQICGRRVLAVNDYLSSRRVSAAGTEAIALPKSNVLLYDLDGGAWMAVRPSGTEPKLKIYMGVIGVSAADGAAQIKALEGEADKLVG